jgi:hypothetical protein
MKKSATSISMINTPAQAARPIDDTDWGTERQINAENAFFDMVKTRMTAGRAGEALREMKRKWDQFEAYCAKATTDESINEALRLLGMSRAPGDPLWR